MNDPFYDRFKALQAEKRERKEVKHHPDWNGHARTEVMIIDSDGAAVHIATIRIEAVPLLVEPWMIRRVLKKANAQLTKYVANYAKGKSVN